MNYPQGLQILKGCLPAEKMDEFRIHESKLLENLYRERLYGSTETIRAERFATIASLNELAHAHCGNSFNDMCYGPQMSKVSTIPSELLQSSNTAKTIHSQEKTFEHTKVIPPRVTVKLLTNTIPTAYYQYLDVKEFPFVTVTIDNTDVNCDDSVLRIQTFIEDYSDYAIERVEVAKDEKKQVAFLLLLKPKAIAPLTEIRPGTLHVMVEQIGSTKGSLHDNTYHIKLHARNTALLAVEMLDGSMKDLTKYLAGWVTPHHPAIDKLLRKAAEHHPERGFVGYGGADTLEETTIIVREQAQAIFETLKYDVDLVYIDSSLSFSANPEQTMQRVRFPTEILESGGSANCLDSTVLFASLLETASIEPLIVLIPGHAFVGWRVDSGVNQYEFLETTLISNANFADAQQSAQTSFENAQATGNFEREIFDSAGFARLIDVVASHNEDIYPLE